MDSTDLFSRGNSNYDSLDQLDREAYHLIDFGTIYQMQGILEFIGTDKAVYLDHLRDTFSRLDGNAQLKHLDALTDFIKSNFSDYDPTVIDDKYEDMPEETWEELADLGDQLCQSLWDFLPAFNEYLAENDKPKLERV